MKNRRAKKIKEISLVKSSKLEGGLKQRQGAGGRASVRRAPRIKWHQRRRKHQHFGLHEGQIGQTGNHFGRLFAQVFVFPGFPVQTGSEKKAPGTIKYRLAKTAIKNKK